MKKHMIMLSPDEGGGSGNRGLDALGPVQTDLVPGDASTGDLEVQKQNELEQGREGDEKADEKKVEEKKTEEKVALTTVVDASALAKEFGSVLSEHFKKEEPTAKKVDDLTPEEAKKLLNVWEPTKEWQAKFDNLETREAALNEMRDGVVKHTDTITQYRVREAMTGMEAKMNPVLEFIKQQQNEQAEQRLGAAYPDLAKPELQPLVSAVSSDLVKQGKKFDSEKDLFDTIAKGVEAVIKVNNPNFKLSSGSNPGNNKPKAKANPNAITVTTPGAGGQAGGKTVTVDKPRGIAIFDK